MPGLIDDDGTNGLCYVPGSGLIWLTPGIGGPDGLIISGTTVDQLMVMETGDRMITEDSNYMIVG